MRCSSPPHALRFFNLSVTCIESITKISLCIPRRHLVSRAVERVLNMRSSSLPRKIRRRADSRSPVIRHLILPHCRDD